MLIKTLNNGFIHPASSEITTERLYRERRNLIKLMASGAAGAAMASWAGREAMAQGEGSARELHRRREEKEAREREARIEHLTEMAAKRMGKKELAMGWQAWSDVYWGRVRTQRMLEQVFVRLQRPKLVSSYVHWRQSWQLDLSETSKLTVQEQLMQEKQKRREAESSLDKVNATCMQPP